ncbi:MAG: hypothetical protein EON51_17390 [Acinetobacter sp.]|nr:MAG: hypothetical protein EON51_17390 [Acinetobacter sp.]
MLKDKPLRKYKALTITLLTLVFLGILVFRSCRYDWNPHYLNNSEVAIDKKLFSPDSSVAVVNYTLDVGTRGTRTYKSLLREKDYDNELTRYTLPPELVVLKWIDNTTLAVKYDPNEIFRLGGQYTALDFTKDTIVVNEIFVVIKHRIKENRDSVFHENFGKYNKK